MKKKTRTGAGFFKYLKSHSSGSELGGFLKTFFKFHSKSRHYLVVVVVVVVIRVGVVGVVVVEVFIEKLYSKTHISEFTS